MSIGPWNIRGGMVISGVFLTDREANLKSGGVQAVSPCDSSYMEPTVAERQRRKAAKLLLYVQGKVDIAPRPWLVAAAKDIYGAGGEHAMRDLCTLLRQIRAESPDIFDHIVYDAHSKISRELANWWEEHEQEDSKRDK